jgi:acetyltransferase-like isoleucine patch superfamily enzyme
MGANLKNMFINTLKGVRDYYLVYIKWRKHNIKRGFHAGRGVVLLSRNKIMIGENFYIGRYSQIECNAIIGNNVMIANQVALIGKYDHNYTEIGVPIRFASRILDKDYNWKGLNSNIEIEDDVWIGYGAIILSGVKIGKGAIVAAGSVVTKDVIPYSIVAGNPARHLSYRFNKEEIVEHERTLYST